MATGSIMATDSEPKEKKTVYPGKDWSQQTPESAGLDSIKLRELSEFIGGQGCVVRYGHLVYSWGKADKSGDIASAMKPILSSLMLMAVQDRLITGVDSPVAEFESRLKNLNSGKDAGITWRHLASQTSGYGLVEKPGDAYSYNDYAIALYYDTLMHGVYKKDATKVLKEKLGDILGFQDRYTFEAFGKDDRPGRLGLSVRDLARFGLLFLRGGKWNGKQILKRDLVELALESAVPADLPLTSGKEALMLPKARSLGGTKNITPVGPGYYSFNWWLNRTNKNKQRLYVDAPPDAYFAVGHGGSRALWVIPSLDLIVAWNDASIDDHDASPGNSKTHCNRIAQLLMAAAAKSK